MATKSTGGPAQAQRQLMNAMQGEVEVHVETYSMWNIPCTTFLWSIWTASCKMFSDQGGQLNDYRNSPFKKISESGSDLLHHSKRLKCINDVLTALVRVFFGGCKSQDWQPLLPLGHLQDTFWHICQTVTFCGQQEIGKRICMHLQLLMRNVGRYDISMHEEKATRVKSGFSQLDNCDFKTV